MKIRRYIGKDVHEAMLKVKMDLGSDAIILNTRKIRQKGFLKLFSKPLIEVLAAIDENSSKADVAPARQDEKELISSGKKLAAPAVTEHSENVPTVMGQTEQKDDQKVDDLEEKVNNIEVLLHRIYNEIQPAGKTSLHVEKNINAASKMIQIITSNLLKSNVDEAIVNEIITKASAGLNQGSGINEIAVKVYSQIKEILDIPQPIQLDIVGQPKTVIFVGPTGAGKTTTLAKVAAIFALSQNKKIGVISTDTYRIAAVEQLKTYTEILGVPIEVVYSPEEIEDALKKFSDKDLILVDTAGRSHKDKRQFDEIKKIVDFGKPHEIFLLISSTTDLRVCKEITDSYSFLNDYKLLITKIDEAADFGMVLNLKKITNKKLSYVTIGQSVPDDIEVVNTDVIAKKLLGSISI